MVGKNNQFWQRGFKEALEGEAKFGTHYGDRRKALFGHGVGADGEFTEKILGGMGVQGQGRLEVGSLNAIDESLLQSGIYRDRFNQAGFGFVLSDEIGAESSASRMSGRFLMGTPSRSRL